MRYLFLFSIIIVLFLSCCTYPNIVDGSSLGNNFSVLEGDHLNDRAIIYCTAKSVGSCYAGIPVIPSRNNSDRGYYVEKIKYDDKWIIAKSYDRYKRLNFWIINKNVQLNLKKCDKVNCDSIIQSHVMGPYNLINFKKKTEEMRIMLKLE